MLQYIVHKKEYVSSLLDASGAGIYKFNHHTFTSYDEYMKCLLDICDGNDVSLTYINGTPVANSVMFVTADIPSGFHTHSASSNYSNTLDSLSSFVTSDKSSFYIFAKNYQDKLAKLASTILSSTLDANSIFKLVEPTDLTGIVLDHVLHALIKTDANGKIVYTLHGLWDAKVTQFVKLFGNTESPISGNLGGCAHDHRGLNPSFIGMSKQFIQINNLVLDRTNNTGTYMCGISNDESALTSIPTSGPGKTISDALLSCNPNSFAPTFCSIDITKVAIHKTIASAKYFEWPVDISFMESLNKIVTEIPPDVPVNKVIVSFTEIQPMDTYTSNTKYSVVSSDPFFYVTKSDTFQQSQLKAKTSRNIKSVLDPILNLLCFMLVLKDSSISHMNESEPDVFKYIFSPALHITTQHDPKVTLNMTSQLYIDTLHDQFDKGFASTITQASVKTNVSALIEKIYSSVPITVYDAIYDNLLSYTYGVLPSSIRSYDRFNSQTEDYITLTTTNKLNMRTNTNFSPALEYVVKSYIHVMYEMIAGNNILRFGTSEIRLNNMCNLMSKFQTINSYNYPDHTFKSFCLNNVPSGIKELDAFTDPNDTSNPWQKRTAIKKTEIPLGTIFSLSLDTMACIKKIKTIKTFSDMTEWYTDNKVQIDEMFDKIINISSLSEVVSQQANYRNDLTNIYMGYYLHKPFFTALKTSLPEYLKLLSDTETTILTPPVVAVSLPTVTTEVVEDTI